MDNSKNNFNQAFWLAVSYTCSMLVGILSSVILSRYFDKIQYGTYRQIIFVYNTLLTIFQAGLPAVFTFFLPRHSREEGKYIVKKLQRMLFGLGACFSIVLYFGADLIASLLKNPELSIGLKIFSVFPIFTLPTLGVEGIYTVNKNTRFVAIYQVVTRLTMLACIVIPVVFIRNDYRYALVGWGIASFVAFVIAIIAKNKAYQDVEMVEIVNITNDIFNYSLPIMGSALVLMVFNSANQFFISRYYGTEAFAEFSNGHMALPFVPVFIAPVRAVLTPIFSRASKNNDYGDAMRTLYSSMKQIMVLMIPLIVFAFCYARDIMVFLYGSQYENSYLYFQIMLLFNFFEILVFSGIMSATGKTRAVLYIDIVCTIALWFFDFAFVKLGMATPYMIMGLYVLFNVCARYIIPGLYLKKTENLSVINTSTIVNMAKILMHTICVGFIVVIGSNRLLFETPLIIRILVSLVVYYLLLVASSRIINVNYFTSFSRFVRKK